MTALSSSLGVMLVALAAGEFVLLRFLLRMGPSLPDESFVDTASRIGYQAGLWALNAGAVLAVMVLVVVGLGVSSRTQPGRRITVPVFATAAILVALWLFAVTKTWSSNLLAVQVIGLPMLAGFAVVAARPERRRALWLAAVLLAQVLAGGSVIARGGGSMALPWLAAAGEIVAVAAALGLPFALGMRLRPGPAIAACGLGLVYLTFATFEPSIARFILIWDFGLPGALPGAVHAISLSAVAYVAVAGLSKVYLWTPVNGALLIILAGLRLENTYFAAIGAAGIYLVLVSGVPGPRPVADRKPAVTATAMANLV